MTTAAASTPATRTIDVSVVIPAFRAERTVEPLCSRLSTALAEAGLSFEIVLVDDGSRDGTWTEITRMTARHPQVVGLRFSRNFGQHIALTAGLDVACGEWIVTMDCDLQDRPEEISRLLARAREGYDVVLARRMRRKDPPLARLSSWFFYRVFRALSDYQLDGTVGTFRIMHRRVVVAFRSMRETYRLFGGMIDWLGFRTDVMEVEHSPRTDGRSTYTLRRKLKLAVDGMVSFSNRPLYASIAIGVVVALAAAGYGGYLLYCWAFVRDFGVPGWLSLVTLQAFLGGLVLFNLGILGLYLGRVYDEVKGRPLYVVAEVSRSGAVEAAPAGGR